MLPSELYAARVADGTLTADAAQTGALPSLDRIAAAVALPARRKGWFGKSPEAVQGLYLWGGVGRGKSMLMDMFVETLEVPTRRVHFHSFMQDIHTALHAARKTGVDDAIAPVAADVARDLRVLAFDEMQITDITDAMIVGRLFEKLFAAGVTIVTTSNRVPDDLYKDGLNRQLFVPFIALLKENLEVHELASPTDYRQGRMQGSEVYFTPLGPEARASMADLWASVTGGAERRPLTLRIKGRDVVLPAFHNGVARATFHDLCGQPLGAADYLELAAAARVVFIEDIPQLGRSNFNQAKRFVTLIDALYEARCRVVISAAAAPEMLYVEGEGTFEFERTASRLREMQAADWGQEEGSG